MKLFAIIIAFCIFEILIELIIKKVKKDFPWFVERRDEYPNFDKIKFKKYLLNSFNPYLGWVRKKNITGYDSLGEKKIKFTIDKDGSRKSAKKNKKNLITCFGGSYVFGRQVKDSETWQEQMSKNKNFYLSNYGVGNYGTDQAIIRYEKTKFKNSTKIVILGIVPEHICRIQSEWKHYFEFGNIHGFKPKYYLDKNKLMLKKVSINKKTKIKNIKNVIDKIKKTDRFYEEKFKKNLFKFPYLLNFFRNFNFNIKILYIFITKKKDPHLRKDFYLNEVIKRNIEQAHNYYKDEYSKRLFLEIIKRFKLIAKSKKQIPILVVFPQKMDIKLKKSNINYKNFFDKQVSKEIITLDLTKFFEKKKINNLYTNKIYGSHLSPLGNKFVSKIIYNFLKKKVNEFK